MKKLILSAAAVALASGAFAATLTPEEALARVQAQGDRQGAPALSSMKLVRTGNVTGVPAYYVFSDNDNAMILSADDIAMPVLGYLDRPVTAETVMPVQLAEWLEMYAHEIAAATKARNEAALTGALTPVKNAPATLDGGIPERRRVSRASIAPMVKTQWDQGAPYNDLCPDGTYTGCVATAMAQAMKFHNYPPKGKGTAKVSYGGKTLSLNLGDITFDWSNMTNTYSGSSTDAQKKAVAQLMQACGYAVDMSYGKDASGASTMDVPMALQDFFSYDVATNIQEREYFDPEEWNNMLYAELSAGRPMIYHGTGSGGGHCFICDGYQTQDNADYFHFNWGWSGSYDGYFPCSSLVPGGQGVGGNATGYFGAHQGAIFNMRKPVSGSKPAEAYLGFYSSYYTSDKGNLIASVSNRNVTLSFDAGNSFFLNVSGIYFSGDIGFYIENTSGKIVYSKELYQGMSLASSSGYTSLTFAIPSSLTSGTFRLVPAYRLSGQDWKPIKTRWTRNDEVYITISGGKITAECRGAHESTDEPEKGPEIEISGGSTSTDFYVGEEYDLTVNITNNTDQDITKNLGTVLVMESGEDLAQVSTFTTVPVSIPAHATVKQTFKATIDEGLDLNGSYYAAIADDKNQIYIYYTVQLRSHQATSNFKVTAHDSDVVTAGKETTVKVTVQNTVAAMSAGDVQLYLCTVSGNTLSPVVDFGKQSVRLLANRSKECTYTGTVPTTLDTSAEYAFAAIHNGVNIGDWTVKIEGLGGVDDIIADENAGPAEYFDLQGRAVNTDTPAPGLYLRRQGGKTTKVLIR